jgi:hypothetical protein
MQYYADNEEGCTFKFIPKEGKGTFETVLSPHSFPTTTLRLQQYLLNEEEVTGVFHPLHTHTHTHTYTRYHDNEAGLSHMDLWA